MTTDELRAAAGRVRRVKAGERQRVVYGFDGEKMDDFMYRMLENAATGDLRILADAYLAEHPADAGEAVTEDWLRAVGAEDRSIGRVNGEPDCRLWLGPAQWFEFSSGGELLVDFGPGRPGGWPIRTRGDARRFAKALGIAIKEPATEDSHAQ